MIDHAHCLLMAQYNQWMNRRLYDCCAQLDEAELKADRGAFFGSIFRTLNHIMYGDLAFLSRFTGDPAQVPEMHQVFHEQFSDLRQARMQLDARLITWAEGLETEWLGEVQTYTSKVDGKQRSVPRWALVTHMFNHQTHHRGQITTLLSQQGLDMGSTDIPFMPHFERQTD